MDDMAKTALRELHPERLPPQRFFPLEPIVVTAGMQKMTTDSGPHIRFWANRQLARSFFLKRGILGVHAFEKVNWRIFYATLHKLPRLFQAWACKQIMDIAGTNYFRAKFTPGLSPKCPSCMVADERCAHILLCPEAGRVENLMNSIAILDQWLTTENTDPELHACLIEYARSRGAAQMYELARPYSAKLARFGKNQDLIGWRRFMEGMVANGAMEIQEEYYRIIGTRTPVQKWAVGLTTQLLECTHSQWLYRNIIVHDRDCGTARSLRKEQILQDIERQLSCEEDLLEEDRYLMEIDVGDMLYTSGEQQEYWLLAVQAARKAKQLSVAIPEGIG